MRAPFVPGNLVKLLRGYAGMQHISSASSSMLDAAAGSVVRRMTAGHLNAVTKVSDLSQLLQAYASLGHKSTVVMPELLHAASNQVGISLHTCSATTVSILHHPGSFTSGIHPDLHLLCWI